MNKANQLAQQRTAVDILNAVILLIKLEGEQINKLHTKLPLILLCTIMIDDGLFDCRVLPTFQLVQTESLGKGQSTTDRTRS